MSDMRRADCAPGRRSFAVRVSEVLVCVVAAGLVAVGHAAAAPVTPPPETAPATLTPPEDWPFDEVVGGAALGTTGQAAVSTGAPPLPVIDGTAWLVADAGSGDVLAALNAHQTLPPASTIKLLTALTLLPSLDADERYMATEDDIQIEGSRVGLVPGQEYTVADLEHGLLLASGNDAAHALATFAARNQFRAADLMNDEAERLGAFDTNATTPHGLDEPDQVSSAYDLALIGRAVLADEELATLVRTPAYAFPGLDGATFEIQNHNRLLGSYDGAIGLKTGFTTLAGHTLVAGAERGDARLIAVVLGAKGRAEVGAQGLLDWAFAARQAAEPVGHLVTPDEVAEALADAEAEGNPEPGQDPVSAVADAVDSATSIPAWTWAAALLVAATAAFGLVWRRRRRPAGRYSVRG
jgi:serine-type D-Ala-D-Ala carboxypeptidase (penicillin-binding protein 5/6)